MEKDDICSVGKGGIESLGREERLPIPQNNTPVVGGRALRDNGDDRPRMCYDVFHCLD